MPVKSDQSGEASAQDPAAIKRIQDRMPAEEMITDMAELFKILGDPTRAKILFALEKEELCVGDIAGLLGMSQSAISHQLRSLKQNRLLRARRDGKQVFYTLHDQHVSQLIDAAMEHILEMWG